MIPILLAICAAAFAYQVLAVVASLAQMLRREKPSQSLPPVSILKPIRGRDPGFYEAIRSHANQNYPDFEMLFGISMPDDPAREDVDRLRAEFPNKPIRVLDVRPATPNGKAGTLAELAAAAKHDILLVNDSDIRVPPEYLASVAGPLDDPLVGIVTCLYRASADSLPGKWEALGIATDFIPSTLVARVVGVKEFGLGSTLVFRRGDLEKIGGFLAIADYLADDYQLARRITALGKRAHLSTTVVETHLQAPTWRAVWHHQVRWHRTIRVSRGGYIGLPLTNASLWGIAALLTGAPVAGTALLIMRIIAALTAGIGVLRCPLTVRWFWLIPLRDLFGVAVWLGGLFGSTVQWRGERFRLSKDGRMRQI
jgi:ceramide glucosyltransferase